MTILTTSAVSGWVILDIINTTSLVILFCFTSIRGKLQSVYSVKPTRDQMNIHDFTGYNVASWDHNCTCIYITSTVFIINLMFLWLENYFWEIIHLQRETFPFHIFKNRGKLIRFLHCFCKYLQTGMQISHTDLWFHTHVEISFNCKHIRAFKNC